MAPELPAACQAEIDRCAEAANAAMDRGDYHTALRWFRQGYEVLPAPREDWSAALWFLCGIGDAQWFLGEHEAGRDTWRDALLAGGIGNAFVHLRRGQTLLELGSEQESANELLRALLLGGEKLFERENPKFLRHVTSVARPPAGMSSWSGWEGIDPATPGFEWLSDDRFYALLPRNR